MTQAADCVERMSQFISGAPVPSSTDKVSQAIEQAAPLPDSDLTLIDELPHAPGLLAQAPDELRERLAAAFGLQAVYRQDTRQATIVLTITDTTPGIINAIAADPRVDDDTNRPPSGPATSNDTSVDVTQSPITPETADKAAGDVFRRAAEDLRVTRPTFTAARGRGRTEVCGRGSTG